jgi:hypothetical protein
LGQRLARLTRLATIVLLWLLALWNSWHYSALFSDGSLFIIDIVQRGGFHSYNPLARQYAIGVMQVPIVAGLWLGVTDLHWLARLLSLGAFAVPVALYHLALQRAKNDAVLIALVIATIAAVFMTTSFFIVGEYNIAYALAGAVVVLLATAERPSLRDGLLLAVLGVLALRTYEVFLYLGPVLAAMTLWRIRQWPTAALGNSITAQLLLMGLPIAAAVIAFLGPYPALAVLGLVIAAMIAAAWRWPPRHVGLASALHYLAAALFLAAAPVAMDSIVRNGGGPLMAGTADNSLDFWQNLPFDLAMTAAAILLLGAFVRPGSLESRSLYLWAALPLVVLAALPLLLWTDRPPRPFGTLHYASRTACGFAVTALVGLIWARAAGWRWLHPTIVQLGKPIVARRLSTFCFAMLLAMLPVQAAMTRDWISAVDALQSTSRSRIGTLLIADLPAPLARLYWMNYDIALLKDLTLVLRTRPTDAVFARYDDTGAFVLQDPDRNLGKYRWRD